ILPSQKQALQDQKNARLCFKIQKNNPTEGQLYYKATTYLTVWAQNLQLKIESEDPEIQKLQKEINQKNANACQKILTMHNLTGSEISPSCKLFLHNWIEEITEQKQEQIKNNSTIKY